MGAGKTKKSPMSRRASRKPRQASKPASRKPSHSRKAAAGPTGKFGRGASPVRVAAILKRLGEAYPDATTALHHENAFQLLVATILSAQSTDVTINQVTPALFATYPTPEALSHANPQQVEKMIYRTGFFRNKAKSIIGASKKIVEDFHGEAPRTMEELLTLPGVARKTANVVLGTAFGIASGIVVDTHVQRLSQRLDLTKNRDPKRIEQDLMEVIPRDKWIAFGHELIWHGRRVCQARKPRCIECTLKDLCYSPDKTI
jgi:endonuclease III